MTVLDCMNCSVHYYCITVLHCMRCTALLYYCTTLHVLYSITVLLYYTACTVQYYCTSLHSLYSITVSRGQSVITGALHSKMWWGEHARRGSTESNCNTSWTVFSVKCAVCSVKCEVFVQCEVFSV